VSKGKKDARQAARELAAAQRRAEQRRKRIIVATSAVGAVVLVLAILVAVKLTQPKKTTHDAQATATASTQLVSAVTGVSPAVLDQAGKGAVETLPAATHGQPVLKDSAGKPIVFYMGAEYCPYCAAERWAMIVALSRFGTFKDLKTTSSSSSDVYPNTPTFSFHGATYSSPYVDFQSKEVQSASGVALETLTADQQRIVKQFDSDGSFPFITFGNQATVTGASFNPQLLAGMTQEQIAQKLADPTSDIGKAILGTANAFTNEICKLTNGQPANVCSTSAAKAFGATGGQG
jgi:thiol-disulfide isomerase/thioredoxin